MAKKTRIPTILAAFVTIIVQAQNPSNITFPTTPNPPNLTVDSYSRAATSINCQANSSSAFIYGSVSGSATNLLNLSIGSNPPFVSSSYLGSGVNPAQPNGCLATIDPSKPVGETAGKFAVSPSGAATYNIPIIMSPGTRGLQPNLSLTYNSQMTAGLMGTGWTLSGLSSISRVNKIPMHDGASNMVELSVNDVFSYDGNRLFALSGGYGLPSTTYYPENENFATITSLGTAGNGPQKFEVKDKDGNTLKFGLDNNSSLSGVGNSSILTWNLNEAKDEFGNYMRYYYKQLPGETVIDKIEYTGNTSGASPYNSIVFDYIPLAEKTTYYVNGVEFRKTQLLRSITSLAYGQIVRKYIFDYNWNNGTYLASVKEVGSDLKELNPTLFCWASPNDNTDIQAPQSTFIFSDTSDYNNLSSVGFDYDGDGFSDFLCFNAPVGRTRVMHNDFKNTIGVNGNLNFSNVFDNFPSLPSLFSQILANSVTDENKDNKQEVYTVVSDPSTNLSLPTTCKFYSVYKTSFSGGSISSNPIGAFATSSPYTINFSPSQFLYNIADYDGDGTNDVLRIDPENINLTIATTNFNFAVSQTGSIVRPFQFNTDRYMDFIMLDNASPTTVNVKIIGFNGSAFSQAYSTSYTFSGNGSLNRNLLKHFGMGDFNGDGYDDLVYIKESRDEMFICYGTGVAFLAPVKVNAFTPLSTSNTIEINIQVADINRDGKDDIIITDSSVQLSSSTTNNYFSYFSIGDQMIKGGSYAGDWSVITKTFNYTQHINTETLQADIPRTGEYSFINGNTINGVDLNGDGIWDATSFALNDNRTITNNINKIKESIFQIQTPMGKKIHIEYANLNNEIYIKPGGAKYLVYKKQSTTSYSSPLFNFKPNIYCVRASQETYGAKVIDNRYIYSDAIFHSKGRGPLGFEKIISFDPILFSGTTTNSIFDTQFYIPLHSETTSGNYINAGTVSGASDYVLDNTKLISKDQNTFQLVARNAKGFFIELVSNTNRDYLKSIQASTSFAYNVSNAGRISSKTVTYGWSGNPVVKTNTDSYTYQLNNGYYKLLSQLTSQVQTGEPSYNRSMNYNYDGSGHLTSTVNDQLIIPISSSNNLLTTTYSQFNSFGIPLQKSISAPDVPSRGTLLTYDATGRFMTQETNDLGNSRTYSYESKYGNLIQETGITGLTTSYVYDGQGRLIKTVLPNGAQNKITYAWESPSNFSYANLGTLGVYSVKTEIEAGGESKIYYTGSGEVLRTETKDFSGQAVISDTKFNTISPKGLVMEVTEPHYVSQQKFLITHYGYETTFYRPNSATTYITTSGNPNFATNSGISTQTTYNTNSQDAVFNQGFVKVVNQNTQSVKKTNNAGGQLINLENLYTSGQQNAVYAYHSCGQPKSITLTTPSNSGQNILHSFTYNDLGQKTQIVDPSQGTISYLYNTVGDLLKQTESTGIFDYTYDNYGRVLTKTGSVSGTTTYLYVASGNGKEMISKIYGPNSTAEYAYDNFNRIIEDKETILSGSKVLKTNYAYDNYGREIQHTYPGGHITKNVYNTYGHLSAIKKNNNQSIWQLVNKDATGAITEYNYGNGINTKNTYDEFHYLEEIEHGSGSIHKQTYDHDPLTGNLDWKIFDNYLTPTSLKEKFTFDDIDRLNESKQVDPNNNTPIQAIAVSYDILGNINSKDDAGYPQHTNTNKPFTMTSITAPTSNVKILNLTNNDFNMVSQLSEVGTSKQMDFTYGVADQRIKMVYSNNTGNVYTRFYAKDYDLQETGTGFKEWTYVVAPTGVCAVNYNNNGTEQFDYLVNDHLGSPILLTDNNQNVVEEYSFDSWGRRRNPTDWSYTNVAVPTKMIRGYTMHEHLEELGMINMNARIYDPVLGSFLQSDDRVTAEDNIQTYNKYGYCKNNPLKYTDPDGHEDIPPSYTINSYNYYSSSNYSWYDGTNTGSMYSTNYGAGFNLTSGSNNASGSYYGGSYSFMNTSEGSAYTTMTFGGGSYTGYQASVNGTNYSYSNSSSYSNSFSYLNSNYYCSQAMFNANLMMDRISNNLSSINTGLQYADLIGVVAGDLKGSLIDYRQTFSIMDKVGMSQNLRSISSIGNAGLAASKYLGFAGNLGVGVSTYMDYQDLQTGAISQSRFNYNLTGNMLGIAVGIGFGAGPGFAVAGSFFVAQSLYDGYNYGVTQISIGVTNYNNAINSGWKP